MKKIVILLFTLISLNFSFAITTWEDDSTQIYTKQEDQVIDTQNLDDPLNQGTLSAVQGVDGIANANVSDTEQKQEAFTAYLSKWINYFLGLLGLVVIILIIKDGIILISSAGDENKKKEAMTNLKNYILALIAIGVSYLLINLIFYFVDTNAKNAQDTTATIN